MSAVVDNKSVAMFLKHLHDPLLDEREPSLSQFIIARATAEDVVKRAVGENMEVEVVAEYAGAIEEWRLLPGI